VIVERRAPKPKPTAPAAPRVDWSDRGDTTSTRTSTSTSVAFFSAKRHRPTSEASAAGLAATRTSVTGTLGSRRVCPRTTGPHTSSSHASRPRRLAQPHRWRPLRHPHPLPMTSRNSYGCFDEEWYDSWCLKHKHAVRHLREALPEVDPCPIAHASQHETRPCPDAVTIVGRGATSWAPPRLHETARAIDTASAGT